MRRSSLCLTTSSLALLLTLSACVTGPTPDKRIKLMPSADGKRTIAVPPECLSWHDAASEPYENVSLPQYGCASARNLAAQVERPEDLIAGRELGKADAVVSAASVQDYRAGRTKALFDADNEAPVASMPTGSGATP